MSSYDHHSMVLVQKAEQKTRRIIVHGSVEGNLSWICGEHLVNVHYMLWTCCVHVVYVHVVSMWWTCHEHVVNNMSWTCREHVMNMSWICYEHVVNMSWTCCKHVVNMLWTCFEIWYCGRPPPPNIIWPYIMCCVATYFQEFAQPRNIWDMKEKIELSATEGRTDKMRYRAACYALKNAL